MMNCDDAILYDMEIPVLQSFTISFEYLVKRNSRPYTMTYLCYEDHDVVKFIKKHFHDDLEIIEKYPVKLYHPSLKKLLVIAETVKNHFNISPIFFFTLMHPKHDELLSFLRFYYVEIVPTNSKSNTGLFLSLHITKKKLPDEFKEILIGDSHDYDKDMLKRAIFPYIVKEKQDDAVMLFWRIKSKDAGNFLKPIFAKSGLIMEYD